MALVSCLECGKQISDKAAACPGCGCPTEAEITKKQELDYSGYTKDALWQKAYDIQYKGKKSDLPIAIKIYEYIICRYENSKESEYAKVQLNILQSRSDEKPKQNQFEPKPEQDVNSLQVTSNDTSMNNCDFIKYYKILGLDNGTSKEIIDEKYNELLEKWNPRKYEDDPNMRVYAENMSAEIVTAYKIICNNADNVSNSPQCKSNYDDKSILNLFMFSLPIGIVIMYLLMTLMANENMNGVSVFLIVINIAALAYVITNYKTRWFKAWVSLCFGANIGSIFGIFLYFAKH